MTLALRMGSASGEYQCDVVLLVAGAQGTHFVGKRLEIAGGGKLFFFGDIADAVDESDGSFGAAEIDSKNVTHRGCTLIECRRDEWACGTRLASSSRMML